jgi:hypothetical protein
MSNGCKAIIFFFQFVLESNVVSLYAIRFNIQNAHIRHTEGTYFL